MKKNGLEDVSPFTYDDVGCPCEILSILHPLLQDFRCNPKGHEILRFFRGEAGKLQGVVEIPSSSRSSTAFQRIDANLRFNGFKLILMNHYLVGG